MDQAARDNIIAAIEGSIEYHKNERGFRKVTFYFTAPKYDWHEAAYNPHVLEVVDAFEKAGCKPQMCDTIPHAANYNRDWWEVTCERCIREYGFTLPVSDDLEAMARIVELENSGEVQFIVYEYTE